MSGNGSHCHSIICLDQNPHIMLMLPIKRSTPIAAGLVYHRIAEKSSVVVCLFARRCGPPQSHSGIRLPDMKMNEFLSAHRSILRTAAVLPFVTVCGIAFGCMVGILGMELISPAAPITRDYVFYWATAQQLAHHSNPYDAEAMTRIEHSAGTAAEDRVGLMRNPPWTLPLVLPLEFLSLRVGWLLWFFLLLGSLVTSVYLLWIIYGRPRNRRYLLGYTFGPALLCMVFGQTSLFPLLGLVLFLCLYRSRPFWAGVSLWLCMMKPQLFLPFGVVLIAWTVYSKSKRLAIGIAAGMATSCAVTYLMNPLEWIQYSQMVRSSGIEREYIPCLSFLLRHWLSPQSIWLQYLPAALGCAWALAYFWRRRQTWDWLTDGSLLMLVSILVAPYTWIYDQGLVIPALLQAAFLVRSRDLLVALAFLSALVEIILYCNSSYAFALTQWTYWTSPAWLIWYLVATTPSTKWVSAWSTLRMRTQPQ